MCGSAGAFCQLCLVPLWRSSMEGWLEGNLRLGLARGSSPSPVLHFKVSKIRTSVLKILSKHSQRLLGCSQYPSHVLAWVAGQH